MADEAFALSPISARASLPSEADYDAIREAFMETARGRWFLAEYTKRNRNADTSMVLEAVTRMEANLAAQKQAPAIVGLIASLGTIRSAIRDAKVTAAEAMPRVDDDETLAAARNGARIIREIAWTLRECGADARICDLLDTQVQAIDAGQQRTATAESRAAVLASFDVLVQRIEQLATGDSAHAAAAAPAAAPPSEQPAAAAEKHAASVTPLFRHAAEAPADFAAPELGEAAAQTETAVQTDVATSAEAVASVTVAFDAVASETVASGEYDRPADVAEAMVETPASMAPSADLNSLALADIAFAANEDSASPEVAEASQHDADEIAEDRAVLDMVAMEMAAPDLSEPETAIAEATVPEMESPQLAEPEMTAPVAPAVAAPRPEPEAPSHPSLGAALIAGGVIPHPNAPASDPLTPIRRMSQAEKIAFFS